MYRHWEVKPEALAARQRFKMPFPYEQDNCPARFYTNVDGIRCCSLCGAEGVTDAHAKSFRKEDKDAKV